MNGITKFIVCLASGMMLTFWGAYFAKGGAVEAAPAVSYEDLVRNVQMNKAVNDVIYRRLMNLEKQTKIKVPKELDIIEWVEPEKK